jgi:hypothetical protein
MSLIHKLPFEGMPSGGNPCPFDTFANKNTFNWNSYLSWGLDKLQDLN